MDINDYQTNEKCGPFFLVFSLTKILKTLAIFLSYDVLKVLPVSLFLCTSTLIIGLFLIVLQKPFTSGQRLKYHQWLKLLQFSLLNCFNQVIILIGLTLCGPLRFILIFEHNEVVVLSILSCLFLMNSNNSTKKSRGTFIFICAIVAILFIDHDHNESVHDKTNPDLIISNIIIDKIISIFGLSDHKLGVILLLLGLLFEYGLKHLFSKKISANIGGFKRLNAFLYVISTVIWLMICIFYYLFDYYSSLTQTIKLTDSFYQSSWHILLVVFLISVVIGVVDFYVSSVTTNKMSSQFVGCYGHWIMSISGLALSVFWNHPYTTSKTVVHKVIIQDGDLSDHRLSIGVVIGMALLAYASYLLASAYNRNKANKGNFVGYSKSGLPLYTLSTSDDVIQRTGQSIIVHLRKTLIEILSDDNSRRIFYYLCINLAFAFVELFYGFLTNSLALISDGFHMLFDSTAIVMGLYAAVVSRWKPTKMYSYGYHRVESLSGFINGLFLVVISISVCCNGISRLLHPPEISTDRLMLVSVLGLLVNLFGMMALGHSHGGQSCGGGSSHSHNGTTGGGGHTHSHGHSHGGDHDSSNMRGVYLHVLADTLGSVGVIFSTILMQQYGWYIADPLCSLFIAVLIFRSVIPLLSQTLSILTLQQPNSSQHHESLDQCQSIIKEILTVDEVSEIRDPYIWQHTSTINCCNIRVLVANHANEQDVLDKIIRYVSHFNFEYVTIQLEKETFETHMYGLGNKVVNNIVLNKSNFTPQVVIH